MVQTNMEKTYDFLDQDQRRAATDQIIGFFQNERDEEIGVIAAGEVLDFVLEHIGIPAYNRGLDDSRNWMKERMAGLDVDFEELRK